MEPIKPRELIEKEARLRGERGTWETHWQEITDFLLPRKNDVTVTRTPGEKKAVQLYDNTGVMANELLAGALHGLLTNPDQIWFELTTGDIELDDDDEVRFWLQDTVKRMVTTFNNSNFQTEIHEAYLDLCSIGTAAISIEEDPLEVLRFKAHYIQDYCVEENNLGIVDALYRKWKWSLRNIVAEYGLDVLSQRLQSAYKKNDTDTFWLVQGVYPKEPGNFRAGWFSQTVLQDDALQVRLRDFDEFPFVVPRWSKASGETYGRSPGMNALPEVKMLNQMSKVVLIGAQKVIDPPLMIPDDGFILPLKTFPGGMNVYRASLSERAMVRPIFNDTRIDFGFQAMEERRKRVRESFYVDQLQLQQGPQMTATEVLQRTEEKMRLLGPLLGRMQSEFLRPLISRTYKIMLRRNLFLPAPIQLQNANLDAKFSSTIARTQRINEANALLQTVQAITPFAQVDPTTMDNFNNDKIVRILTRVYGAPQAALRNKDEVDGIREQRAQAQQQAINAEQERIRMEQMSNLMPALQQAQEAPIE